MFKKQITYENFNGEEVTEVLYFNLTEAELLELELTHPGGYSDYLNRIIEAKDRATLVAIFKELILLAYGEKSPDGRSFMKSPEISHAFQCTNAYNVLFMELATNDEAAAAFANGVVPKALLDKVKAEQAKTSNASS